MALKISLLRTEEIHLRTLKMPKITIIVFGSESISILKCADSVDRVFGM